MQDSTNKSIILKAAWTMQSEAGRFSRFTGSRMGDALVVMGAADRKANIPYPKWF